MALSHSPNIITNGLVLCLDAGNRRSYPGTGTTWYDLSGNNNHGTLTNGPVFNSINYGNIVLDGTNDYIDCGSFQIPFVSACTISIWILNNNVPSVNKDCIIVGWGSTYYATNGIFLKMDNGGGNLRYIVQKNSGGTISSAVQPVTGMWTNLVLSIQKNVKDILYINGKLDSSAISSNDPGTGSNLYIGAIAGSTAASIKVAQCYFYSKVLSLLEIQQNYNATRKRFGL